MINGTLTLSETVLNPLVKVGNNFFAQINGNPFPNAPDCNLNLSARYDFPISDTSRVFVGGDFNMQGKTNFVAYQSVEYRADGNYELGAKIGYAFKTYVDAWRGRGR